MKIIDTPLPGCKVIEPRVFGDGRGFFYEAWNRARFCQLSAEFDVEMVQSNVSSSSYGVLRGLHFQWPHPQGKLVSVLEGEVYDVAVDVRIGSPHYGRWTAAVLSAQNLRHFWIPEGFAHGFCVLSERALFTYLCTAPYNRETEVTVRWDDPAIAIDWPLRQPLLSAKDANAPLLADLHAAQRPPYQP